MKFFQLFALSLCLSCFGIADHFEPVDVAVETPADSAVKLTVTKALALQGVDNPDKVGSYIVIDSSSKPRVVPVAVIKVETKFETVRLKVRKSLFESIDAEKVDKSNTWIVSTPGKYAIEVRVFDKQLGYDEAEAELILEALPDVPTPTPGPAPPSPDPKPDDVNVDSQIAKDSRTLMQSFVKQLATNLVAVSNDVKDGKLKTVTEVAQLNHSLFDTARLDYNKAMSKIMQPQLGAGALPATAQKVLLEISKGIGSVK